MQITRNRFAELEGATVVRAVVRVDDALEREQDDYVVLLFSNGLRLYADRPALYDGTIPTEAA